MNPSASPTYPEKPRLFCLNFRSVPLFPLAWHFLSPSPEYQSFLSKLNSNRDVFIAQLLIGESATPIRPPGIRAKPHTGSRVASANMLRLTPKVRSRSQSQCKPPDMRGTLARSPGWRPGLSTRRCQDNAGRRSVIAAQSLSRARRLRSNDERSRVGLLRIDVG